MAEFVSEASERCPEVVLDSQRQSLVMRGEIYPEDAANFFQPLFDALHNTLPHMSGQTLGVDLTLSYFNSSSAKALMNLFDILEGYAQEGVEIAIRWHYEREDEAIEEFGEDFAEDFEAARFELCPFDSEGES